MIDALRRRALVAAALVAVAGSGLPGRAAGPPRAAAGGCPADARKANLNFTLEDVDGRKVKLSSFKGRTVLLDFWATWCAPCKVEIPWFGEFQQRYAADGLQVIGVSVDDPLDRLRPFVEALKVPYVVLQGRPMPRILDAYDVGAVPTTMLISREGRICTVFAADKTKEDVETAIRRLLFDPAPIARH